MAAQPEEFDTTSKMKKEQLEHTEKKPEKNKRISRTYGVSENNPIDTDKLTDRIEKFFKVSLMSFLAFIIAWLILFSNPTPTTTTNVDRVILDPPHSKDRNQQDNAENDEWRTRYQNLENQVRNTYFYVGEPTYDGEGKYDAEYKMFFEVRKGILLKSVKVLPEEPGTIKILMCNARHEGLQRTKDIQLTESQTWQEVELNFEIPEGQYYLTFSGDTKLFFLFEYLRYPYRLRGIAAITGCDFGDNYENTRYYQYFYDWKVALLYR